MRGPSLALWAAAALSGCMPLASFRPASGLMPGRSVEVGAGAAVVSSRPFVEEPWRGAGQIWMTRDAGSTLSVALIGAFDTDAAAIGGALRVNLLATDRVAAGVEAELGYAWAAFSLPLAVRTVDETWLYTGPRAGTWGMNLLLSVPAGASVRVVDGFMLRTEAQVSWQDARRWNRRAHLGVAAAHQR